MATFGPSFSGSMQTIGGISPECHAMPVNVALVGHVTATLLGHELEVMAGRMFNKDFDFYRPDIPACHF